VDILRSKFSSASGWVGGLVAGVVRVFKVKVFTLGCGFLGSLGGQGFGIILFFSSSPRFGFPPPRHWEGLG
jgi:hypothetical protein